MQITTIGLDLAEHVFQIHGIDAAEKVVGRRPLRRSQVKAFFEALAPYLIGMEACATSHYWARELTKLGHEVRLMPAKNVKAYVKRNKNDAVDAEAICEAVRRPTMRFVRVKSAEQSGSRSDAGQAHSAGGCFRLRPEQRNHVWSYDFVEDRPHDGRKYRMLNVLDEFTHECLAIRVVRKLKAIDMIDILSDLFILHDIPAHIRSDNGPEFVAKAVQEWIAAVGAKTALPRAGQSLGGRLHRELQCPPSRRAARRRNPLHSPRGPNRHRELAAPLNTIRPHASLGYKAPASEAFVPACLRRVAGCATPTGSAGHAGATGQH